MPSTSFKVSFTLDDQDVAYFRSLFRKAKAAARDASREHILTGARELVANVRRAKKTPKFVISAVEAIEDLVAIIEDTDYKAPKGVVEQVLGALAYFTEAEDLIPDSVPVLGFLDDAIMIKFIEREFRHELAAYRKFKRFRGGAEQRPWTNIARERLPVRLEAQRRKLREQIERRRQADESKGLIGF
jgi:uncharacterized membrane protein YkvA (DUF1232 family)